jgi:septal ring factor EnvC (AmiA/AmiB activator)
MSETSSHSHVAYPPAKEEDNGRAKTPSGIRSACLILAIAALVLGFIAYQENSVLTDTKAQLAQANAETGKAKAELAKANAQSADLQAGLDKANARSNDFQTQLRTARSQGADLQAQLEKARSRQSDMQAQLDAARERSADLRARLNRADNGSSELRKELDASKAQTADLQAQLAKAQDDVAKLQPLASKARAMPVAATFKKAFWGGGFTLQVRNQNPAPLKVSIAVAGSEKTPPNSATIESGSTYEVENLTAGANVVITSDGYDPLNLTVR